MVSMSVHRALLDVGTALGLKKKRITVTVRLVQ